MRIGGAAMKPRDHADARKRPVNLTLNEDLIAEARELTDNLSAVVESLLAGFVEQERQKRIAKEKSVAATMAAWNAFNDKHGSFADEHSAY
jgi:antitoxin CcdA